MASGEAGRKRGKRRSYRVRAPDFEWQNPYPHMSSIEAMVHLELERREVPFSWRYFDGDAIHFKALMPSFAPEFTLREYRVVILIIGNFFGALPGVIDSNSLAASLLEADGWKVVILFEGDIRKDVKALIDKELPQLVSPTVKGEPRPNPYGNVDLMKGRREALRGQALARAKFALDPEKPGRRGNTSDGSRSRNLRSRRRSRRQRASGS